MSTTVVVISILAVLFLAAALVRVRIRTLHRTDDPPVPEFNPYHPWDRPLGSDTYRNTEPPDGTTR